MVGNHVHHIVLTLFVRPCYGCSLHAVIVQETGCTACSVNLIALLHQFLGRLQQAYLALGTTTRNQDVRTLLRQTVARGNQRVQHSLVQVVAQTAYLTRRAHVHAQYRVSVLQTGKRELAGLHADAVNVKLALVWARVGGIKHDLRSRLDEVTLQNLADEGERTAGTQVTLNHLHLAVLGEELDVERT